MPTPSSNADPVDDSRSSHLSCPPDEDRWISRLTEESRASRDEDEDSIAIATIANAQSLPPSHSQVTDFTEARSDTSTHIKEMDLDEEESVTQTEVLSPISTGSDKHAESDHRLAVGEMGTLSSRYEFSNIRVRVV